MRGRPCLRLLHSEELLRCEWFQRPEAKCKTLFLERWNLFDVFYLLSKVELAVWIGCVGHGRPGEVDDVEADEAALEQPGVRLVLLDDRQHRCGRGDDAQNHVEPGGMGQ